MERPEIYIGVTEPGDTPDSRMFGYIAGVALGQGQFTLDMPKIAEGFEKADKTPKDIIIANTTGLDYSPEAFERSAQAYLKEYYEAEIEHLNFSVRTYNVLRRRGIEKIGQILENGFPELNNQDIHTLQRIGHKRRKVVGLGKSGMAELLDNLREHGIWPFNQELIEKSFTGYDELTFRYGSNPRDFNWDAYKERDRKFPQE